MALKHAPESQPAVEQWNFAPKPAQTNKKGRPKERNEKIET
jgi:hypothetical protein